MHVRLRLELVNFVVGPLLLWCCGTWSSTTEPEAHLRSAHRRIVWKIIAPRRREHVDLAVFMSHANIVVNETISCSGVGWWDVCFLKRHAPWAAWRARSIFFDDTRLTWMNFKLCE